MQKQIKTFLKQLDIKIDDSTNSVIWAIKARLETYGEIGLSRKEFERFNTTETILRKLIEQLRQQGLLIKTGMRKGRNNRLCNIYTVSEEFYRLITTLGQGIKDMFIKIQEWSKFINPIEILSNYGVRFKNYRTGKIEKGLSVNKRNGAITNWKTGETYGVFSYIQKLYGLTSYQLATDILTIK